MFAAELSMVESFFILCFIAVLVCHWRFSISPVMEGFIMTGGTSFPESRCDDSIRFIHARQLCPEFSHD
jgi:hypothetical protein